LPPNFGIDIAYIKFDPESLLIEIENTKAGDMDDESNNFTIPNRKKN